MGIPYIAVYLVISALVFVRVSPIAPLIADLIPEHMPMELEHRELPDAEIKRKMYLDRRKTDRTLFILE